jgi:glycosyltransferase involved in cell wall biosynthesis
MRAMQTWAKNHLASLAPDLVHAHAVDVGATVVGTAKDLGIPTVLTCHGVWFPHRPRWSPLGWIERSFLHRGYEAITSVDRASVKAIRDEGLPKAVLVPNGVDVSEFVANGHRTNPIRFLFVGRHVYQKGIDVLLDATALVRSRTSDPFVLELAGDGPERPRLERKVQALGLTDTVRFLGSLSRPDLVQAYGRATAFVLPSRFEGFPLAILEAWAARLPVIATEVGGVSDLCSPENSILVPSERPEALSDAMTSLLQDPLHGERLGRAGHVLVQDRYSWDAVASQYDRVYAECRSRTMR